VQYNTGSNMLDIKQFSSDLIDSYLDILTFDEKLLVFKEIKIIFTRYDFDLLFTVGRANYFSILGNGNIGTVLGFNCVTNQEISWLSNFRSGFKNIVYTKANNKIRTS
jgi:hypothetical protein